MRREGSKKLPKIGFFDLFFMRLKKTFLSIREHTLMMTSHLHTFSETRNRTIRLRLTGKIREGRELMLAKDMTAMKRISCSVPMKTQLL